MRRTGIALSTVLVLAILAPGTRAAAADGPSLCKPPETVAFSCPNGGKLASLCATRTPDGLQLRYAFGTPGRIEFAYPVGAPAKGQFRHGHIMYSGLGGDYIRFSNGAYSYYVFYMLGHDIDTRGLVVEKDGKSVTSLTCGTAFTDELTTTFFKAAKLPELEIDEFVVPDVFFRSR